MAETQHHRIVDVRTPRRLLVVDDDPRNRAILAKFLGPLGHEVIEAEDGRAALAIVESMQIDLILLDVHMPGIDGIDVLMHLRARPEWALLPVVLVTGLHDRFAHVQGLDAGADDFLEKPVDPAILRARVKNLLQLKIERERSEQLLLNVLPPSVAVRLKRGETIADHVPDVTVLFADIVGFTALASAQPAGDTVAMLDQIFTAFDHLADEHHLEKIKTIGDAYFAVGGLFGQTRDHVADAAAMALDMMTAIRRMTSLDLRVGIHTGPVVAGIVGMKKFAYDVWGDTVNIASRMESHGVVGRIQVSDVSRTRLADKHGFEQRSPMLIKGKGIMQTWLLVDPRQP